MPRSMPHSILWLLPVLIFLSACHGNGLRVATYGSPVTGESLKQVELARVLESPDAYSGRTIEIRGEVVEV